MLQEIIIIFDEKNNSKKGTYFENLVNDIFAEQRYQIYGNVNVTGQEFDLICTHKDRNNEKILIECKAKESLPSSDLNLFNFKVLDNSFTHGIFIYNKNFEHQVKGTIDKWETEGKYKNLSFWNGAKVIELLVESRKIKKFEFDDSQFQLTKVILFFSYDGFYYIPLFSDTTQPKYFSIYNAKSMEVVNDSNTIDIIKKYVKDTQQIELYEFSKKENQQNIKNTETELETIAEVSESQSWYDYKPASLKYFVGRDEFTAKIMDLLKDISNKTTEHRIFYIDGKSGWGKSSLLVALKGKLSNKQNKNKYFPYIVDSRSANAQSFISLAFNNMLHKAYKNNFIPKELSSITIPSHFDIMGAKEITSLENYLITNNKLLILVFDQFEDIFRKESVLQSFFKLLTDIKAHQSNIILGFSWKSETIISADEKNISRLLSQSKEHAVSITVNEFTITESKKFIKQLEGSIKVKLDEEFKRRIIDNSQGFPWLVKKLCVHIYKQVQAGVTLDDLFSQDLNVESLFKKDLEECNDAEIKAIELIAKRAYEGNMFDRIEVDEIISQEVITALTNKNLIIKTGTKYNIYWDIFRDYLVTEKVPKVGETYLIRSTPNPVFEILSIFENKSEMTLDAISEYTSSQRNTVDNLLRTLRDFGLVKYANEKFSLKNTGMKTNENDFKKIINKKLQNHTFYLELMKITDKKITLEDLIEIIKLKNNSDRKYQEKTLTDYAQKFLLWLSYTELKIGNLEHGILQKARNENSFTPQEKPTKVIKFFNTLDEKTEYPKESSKLLYDLKSLGLITYKNNQIKFTDDGLRAKENKNIIFENALKTDKIKFSYNTYFSNPNLKKDKFKDQISDLLTNLSHKSYINATGNKLYDWAELIYKYKQSEIAQ
ncbi:MAG: restriction endonuclease [Campylobacterales bacterium]|nr:restriction endonuclease [Campylobacterales bacterium]